ncbi:MAG: hypothetical protein R3A79_00745 [Nannocystaceae bacterium]
MQPNAPTHPALRRITSLGFAVAATGAVLHLVFRLVLVRTLDAAATEGQADLLRLLGDASFALHTLGWIAVIGGAYRLRAAAPRALIQAALALWTLSLLFDVAAEAMARSVVADAPFLALGVAIFVAEVLGSVAALRFHSVRGAPANKIIFAAVMIGLRSVAWALLVLGDGLGPLGALWPILRAAQYLALAILPWAASAASPEAAAPVKEARERGDATRDDLLFGGIALAIGLFLTAGSFAAGGFGGRVLLAWGPVVYGAVRIFRGLTRSS